jgi:hypothetical protein
LEAFFLGRVKIKVDQIGTTVSMIYDLAGRLTEKQYHTGNRLTAWQTPPASASSSTQTWNYHDAGSWHSTTKTIAGNTNTENRSHTESDQVTQIAGNTTTHDLKHLTDYEINSKEYKVTYDLDNRIIKVKTKKSLTLY